MWTTQHYFEVAAWWPGEGYGGPYRLDTIGLALAKRQQLLDLGYRNVHIREVTTRVFSDMMTNESEVPELTQRRMRH